MAGMSFGDRIGLASLLVGLVGIGIAVLYPNKRSIGWLCIASALGLAVWWAAMECNSSPAIINTQKPYDLTGRRRERFLNFLRIPPATQRYTIRVGCTAWSEESCVAAGSFLLLFSEAGWPIEDAKVFRLEPNVPMSGIAIAYHSDVVRPKNLPPHLGVWDKFNPNSLVVYNAFSRMGIPVGFTGGQDFPKNELGIYFGPEPVLSPMTVRDERKSIQQQIELDLLTAPSPERKCSVSIDECKREAAQWETTVATYLENCDCGIDPSFSRRWNRISSHDQDIRIVEEKNILNALIATINKQRLGDFLCEFCVFQIPRFY
jgi:hypothetical protein